ncbi:hypothetical protein C8A00DRAFT_45787 [Chaetomidium leptoderma]|uniref:Rhodopsin domain-containing protein n=1 Tax=Chaetomidium leptoderma TaxID=669021 RepID=A0AAN6ZUM6_9PEZI|nr:hypothetical protein C8A00DRAFT_45787 [Chaetomidium leptoderma]
MAWTERGALAFACAVVMVVLSAVAVALRLVSRGRILRILGPTDWFMVLTLFFSTLTTIGVGVHVTYGLGRHITDFSPDELATFFKVVYISVIVNGISLVLTKASVLLLFLDIIVITWIRKATYVVTALVACYGVWLTASNIFFCIPVQSFWDSSIPEKRCIPSALKGYLDAGVNLALDVVIFCLPLPIVGSLRLPRRQKLWLSLVFALGSFVCVASIVRFRFLDYQLILRDPTWGGVDIICWSTVEINVSIIIACIPTLRPLVAKLYPRLLDSPPSSETGSGGSN